MKCVTKLFLTFPSYIMCLFCQIWLAALLFANVVTCKYSTFQNDWLVVVSFTGVYLLAFVISLPPLFGWAAYAYIPIQSFCFCDWTLAPSYAIFMISCCFGVPFSVMTVCNILIFYSAKKSNKNTKYFTTTKEKKRDAQTKELRLASILLVVVIAFFISWCPYCISMLLSIYAPGVAPRGFHMFTILVGYANSGVNPIIYGVMNRSFRNGFKQLYCGWMGVTIEESTAIGSNSDEPSASGIQRNATSDSRLSAAEELVIKSWVKRILYIIWMVLFVVNIKSVTKWQPMNVGIITFYDNEHSKVWRNDNNCLLSSFTVLQSHDGMTTTGNIQKWLILT